MRFLTSLPPLIAALAAVGLAVLYLDHGSTTALVVVVVVFIVIGVVFMVARAQFQSRPYPAGLALDASALALTTLGAAVAGAVLVWLAIDQAPDKNASVRSKEVFSAISAAITAYLGSVVIDPEGDHWNPVKGQLKKVFADTFQKRRTTLEKDADDARKNEDYGALDASHADEVVSGWGWKARRARTRHVRDALADPGSHS